MRIVNIIAYALVIIGAVNWGLFGLFDFNLVSTWVQGLCSQQYKPIKFSIFTQKWLFLANFLLFCAFFRLQTQNNTT